MAFIFFVRRIFNFYNSWYIVLALNLSFMYFIDKWRDLLKVMVKNCYRIIFWVLSVGLSLGNFERNIFYLYLYWIHEHREESYHNCFGYLVVILLDLISCLTFIVVLWSGSIFKLLMKIAFIVWKIEKSSSLMI